MVIKVKYAAQKHGLQRVKDKCVVLQKMSQGVFGCHITSTLASYCRVYTVHSAIQMYTACRETSQGIMVTSARASGEAQHQHFPQRY